MIAITNTFADAVPIPGNTTATIAKTIVVAGTLAMTALLLLYCYELGCSPVS